MTRAAERTAARVLPLTDHAPSAVLDRVLWRVRLRIRQRLHWLSSGLAATADDELHAQLTGRDDLRAELAWRAHDAAAAELEREISAIETEIARDETSRLARLRSVFGLSSIETDALHAVLAAALDPAVGRGIAAITGRASGGIQESAMARLFGHELHTALPATGPLMLWELVRRHEMHADAIIDIDPFVRAWLPSANREELDAALVDCARPGVAYEPLSSWPVDDTVAQLTAALEADGSTRIRVQVLGQAGSGRRTFAAVVAGRLGFRSIVIDGDAVDPASWPQIFRRAQRQAFVTGSALIFAGDAVRRRWPAVPDMFAVQFAVADQRDELPPHNRLVDIPVKLALPGWRERRALWRGYVRAAGDWDGGHLNALARTHRVGPGEIAAVARRSPATAAQAGRIVRQVARHRLSDLAEHLATPFGWDDLVVDARMRGVLDDIVFEASYRSAFWERPAARRLFPQGRGLGVLFSGQPGTGKTMAVQCIARELRRDCFRILLPNIISKYVGESAQRLASILDRTTDAILLFDEADALFAKRTEVHDAHDRYAAGDTAALLTAIEQYQGVAFLCTNRRASLDPAYLRRMRYSLDFPKPGVEQRQRLWRQLVDELASVEVGAALAPALRALGEGVDATGAQIKGSVLSALFIAAREHAPLTVDHLLRALDRELVKEGRVLSDRERHQLRKQVR